MSEYRLHPARLLQSLQQAQAALLKDADAGVSHTWVFPAGSFSLPYGLVFGAEGVKLTWVGRDTTLVFSDKGTASSAALELKGDTLILQGIDLQADNKGDLKVLKLSAGKRVLLQGLGLSALRGADVVGVEASAPEIELLDLMLSDVVATRDIKAVSCAADNNLKVAGIRLQDLRGRTVSGAELMADNVRVQGVVVGRYHAADDTTGLRVKALSFARLRDIAIDDLSARRVIGVDLDAPAGEVAGLRSERMTGAEQAMPLRYDTDSGVELSGLSVLCHFTADGLHDQLNSAVEEVATAVEGSDYTWVLPAGEYDFEQGLNLDNEAVSLHIRGPAGDDSKACWRFGAGAPLAGDLAAISLRGSQLSIDGLTIEARCSGALTAVRMDATVEATADDLRLNRLQGASVIGLQIDAPRTGLTDIDVKDLRATDGAARAILARAQELSLQRIRIEEVRASRVAIGLKAQAERLCSGTSLSATAIAGDKAYGQLFRLSDTSQRLMLVDISTRNVTALSEDQAALGMVALSAGALELLGASTTEVHGGQAIGVLLGSGKELSWLGGIIRDVRGLTGGAVGVRVLCAESEQTLHMADLHLEAIRATPVSEQVRPSALWGQWWRSALAEGSVPERMPAAEADAGAVGLHVDAQLTESAYWASHVPGELSIEDSIFRRISGVTLQLSAGFRNLELRRCEAWTSLCGGWIDGERLLMAQLTWHRHLRGISIGPAAVTMVNCLVTGISEGVGIISDADTDFDLVTASYVSAAIELFQPEPEPLPYQTPGPSQIPPSALEGALVPQSRVDLKLRRNHGLKAVRVPGDDADATLYVGAHEPDQPPLCELRDPQPVQVETEARPQPASPVVDYRSRDARSLLTVMMDRAEVTMPQWQDRNAADQLTMLMELMAHELDHLSYRQEVAMSEGYFDTAMSRRSVEDHAQLVDYLPDSGLSATTMMRFDIDEAGSASLNIDPARRLEIPADTLVVNPDASEVSLVFATEETLHYDPQLRDLNLKQTIGKGSVTAVLDHDLVAQGYGAQQDSGRIESGRWLVFVPEEPEAPSHVVRVVTIEADTDGTRIYWDPRRPAPIDYPIEGTHVYGNVVPAHHGLPLLPISDTQLPGALYETIEYMQPWREQMTIEVDNRDGSVREVGIPLEPVSVQARGWPLPDEAHRQGIAAIDVWVDGERWKRVDQLALCSSDECYVLRTGMGGGSAIRFGDGINGAALPTNILSIKLRVRIGLGCHGNVGVGALRQLLAFGEGGDIAELLPQEEERDLIIQQSIKVDNVVPGIGGRDPESIAQIKYQAPRQVRESLSAVALADFARLLEQMPEVAAARAVLVEVGIRRLVRVTVLLKDEDELVQAELGPQQEAERLRRWAAVRHRLEGVRLLGYDVELLPPVFVQLDLDILVNAEPWASAVGVRAAVEAALAGADGLFDPDRRGLGRDVHVDRLQQSVLAVEGVASARILRLRRLQPEAMEYANLGRLPIGPDEVAVLRHPYGANEDGLVTVQVCGGMT